MDSDQNQTQSLITNTTTFRCPPNIRRIHLRRRKLPYIRLGGGKKKPRTGHLLVIKILKKIRLRWLKLQYLCMVKKLKQVYAKMIKDLIEAGTAIESFQHQISMESSFALPITGVSFANYPSGTTGSTYRSSYMF